MKKVEMIIEYTTDGTDYQYNDNHGVLTRCKDCKWFKDAEDKEFRTCIYSLMPVDSYDYCSKAERM